MSEKIIHEFSAMGSPCKLVFYPEQHFDVSKIIRLVCTEILRLEQKYSRFKETSVTSEINRVAGHADPNKRKIVLDRETIKLLNFSDVAYTQSNGLFDISSGKFRQIWNMKSNHVPCELQINAIKKQVGWCKVNWQAPLLCFPFSDMELDFGGLVKEYAVDKVCAMLKNNRVNHSYVDLGGDIGIVGPRINGLAWNIGVRNPMNPNDAIATIELYKGSIASSGDYERYMEINGQRYTHIINPKTGSPVTYWAGISVVAPQCIVAGTAATTAMLKEQEGAQWLQELGLRALAINNKGEIYNNLTHPTLEKIN